MNKKSVKNLRNNFVTGLLVILPLVLTILIFKFLVSIVNNIMLEPIIQVFKPYLPGKMLLFLAKFSVFTIVILLIVFIGYATRIIILRKSFQSLEALLFKIPLISKVYSAMKDMSHAFFGNKEIFLKVVAIEYPRKGLYSIAFITSHENLFKEQLDKKEVVNVFVPTTPNPTTGMLVLVPKDEIMYLNISVEEGIKLVISGGLVLPKNNKAEVI